VKENKNVTLVLKAALIAFHHIPGSHIGQVLGSKILELIDHVEVKHTVESFIVPCHMLSLHLDWTLYPGQCQQ
jgi:hypothetical protein